MMTPRQIQEFVVKRALITDRTVAMQLDGIYAWYAMQIKATERYVN